MRSLFGMFICLMTAVLPLLAQRKAVLKIDTRAVKNTVSSNLHGVFFEEISHGGEGGLYAEMVRNRGFEDNRLPQGTHLENGLLIPARTPHYNLKGKASDWTMPWIMPSEWPGWTLEKSEGADISITLTSKYPFTEASPQSMQINIDQPGKGTSRLVNEGFWGMGVTAGKQYNLSFYARGGAYSGPLTVMLIRKDGSLLAEQTIAIKRKEEWQRYSTSFIPSSSDSTARLAFSFTSTGRLWLDFVSLFPEETFKGRPNGLRKDIAQYIADLRPAFVRWPGGCYVEGINVESAPNWKRTLGPVENRPGTFSVWGYWSSDGFGYHEYLQFCEDIGAAALYVFNAGVSCEFRSGTFIPDDSVHWVVKDVLDAIEYAIGPVTSRYGRMRAGNGHPAPFPLKYIEVGNEQHGPWYANRYNLFHAAIKEKYPELTVISSMGIGDVNRWTLDSINVTDMADEHAYKSAWWSFANYDHFDGYKRGDYDLYVGEYATNAGVGNGNMLAAMNDAAYIMGMENNGDLVKMSSYAPLLENVHSRHWPVNLIHFNSSKSYARISYYVIRLFSEYRADENLPVQLRVSPETIPAPRFSGGIGLATWDTQTEYKDIEVTENGRTVYRSDFNSRADEWQLVRGSWEVQNGSMAQKAEGAQLLTLLSNRRFNEYTIRLKGRKLSGYNAFIIPFAVQDEQQHHRVHIGSYWNQYAVFELVNGESVANLSKSVKLKNPIETGKWYDIRIEVGKDKVAVFLDGDLLMSYAVEERIKAIAGRRNQSSELVIKLVNAEETAVDVELNAAGVPLRGKTGWIHLIEAPKNAEHSFEHPARYAPVTTQVSFNTEQPVLRLPANSIMILRIR